MLPVNRFIDFVEQHRLFDAQRPILAAVSGGMDSVLMAHLLKAAGYNFAIAHCNFKLRGADADADEHFCRELAIALQVPFHTVGFETQAYAQEHKLSIQMAARELRYEWFEQLRQQYACQAVALAHHQNDTVETILLNLTRGTGIAGLHGILPKNNYWVRPLMFLTRTEIEQIVTQNQLPYREDASNASVKYARNKIRHQVIPRLKELNPNLENTFERNLQHFTELEQLLNHQLEQLRLNTLKQKGDEVWISINEVKQLYPQHLLLQGLLKPYGFNPTVTSDVLNSLPKHSGRVFESAGYTMVLDREALIIKPKQLNSLKPIVINDYDTLVSFGQYQLSITYTDAVDIAVTGRTVMVADAQLLNYPLILRTWQQGDRFMPLGMSSHKKISDFFINQKVPLHQKAQIPILLNGNGEVIWVAGYRMDNRYKVTPQTKKVAIFELLNP